jgi:hypothetical protein
MSTQLKEAPAQSAAEFRHVGPAEHPRGTGFRVLSRLARKRADEAASAYAPRHRMDGEPDAFTAVG